MGRDEEERAAHEEDPGDRPRPLPRPPRERPAGDLRDLFVLLERVLAGRELQQDPEINDVRQRQERRVPERQAPLRPDDDEVGERREEADDLDRVLVVQLNLQELPAVLPAGVERRDRGRFDEGAFGGCIRRIGRIWDLSARQRLTVVAIEDRHGRRR